MENCFCGSKLIYAKCCEPFLNGVADAPTAESLMRSRYSAFCTCNVDYILSTYDPETRPSDEKDDILKWAQSVSFTKLEIISTSRGGSIDKNGRVTFYAHFIENGETRIMKEDSSFRKINDLWYYVDGKVPENKNVDRNSLCFCGSGKKHKKCCLNK